MFWNWRNSSFGLGQQPTIRESESAVYDSVTDGTGGMGGSTIRDPGGEGSTVHGLGGGTIQQSLV